MFALVSVFPVARNASLASQENARFRDMYCARATTPCEVSGHAIRMDDVMEDPINNAPFCLEYLAIPQTLLYCPPPTLNAFT